MKRELEINPLLLGHVQSSNYLRKASFSAKQISFFAETLTFSVWFWVFPLSFWEKICKIQFKISTMWLEVLHSVPNLGFFWLDQYSMVPITRHGSINRHTSFIWPCTFPKIWGMTIKLYKLFHFWVLDDTLKFIFSQEIWICYYFATSSGQKGESKKAPCSRTQFWSTSIGAPLVKTLSTYCIYFCRCVF